MARMAKYLTLCLVVILALCNLIMVESASAQSIPKPSVPEFTVELVDDSYYVQPTFGIDQYTGKNITLHDGFYLQNRSIVLSIRNQPYVDYIDSTGKEVSFFYDVQWKGHFGNNWLDIKDYLGGIYVVASNYLKESSNGIVNLISPQAEFTIINFGVRGNNDTAAYTYDLWVDSPSDGQVDFQVEALIGNYFQVMNSPAPGFGDSYNYVFNGQSSGWSPTQTLTIPANYASPTPSPTVIPSPSLPNNGPTSPPNINSELVITLTWLIIGFLVISVISLLLYVRHLKKRKPQN